MKLDYYRGLLVLMLIPQLAWGQEWNLEKCIQYALENNKELISKSHKIDIDRIEKKREISKLFPRISFDLNLNNYWKLPVQYYPGELVGLEPGTTAAVRYGTNWMSNYTLNLDLPLVDVEIWKSIKLYSLKKLSTELSINSLTQLLKRNVAIAYYATQIDYSGVEIAREKLKNYSTIHNLMKEQLEKGIIDKVEYNQSENILNSYKDNLEKKEAIFEKSTLDLKYWLGCSLNEIISIKKMLVLPLYEQTNFNEFFLPTYCDEESKIAIAEQEYKISKSSFMPTISLAGYYDKSGFGNKLVTLKHASAWYGSGFIGLKVKIPLLDYGKIYSLKKKKSVLIQKKKEFVEYMNNQEKEYMQEQINIRHSLKSIEYQRRRVEIIEENERLSMAKIRKGIIDMDQLKEVQRDLLSAQEEYKKSQLDYLKSYVICVYLQCNR